MRMMVKYLSHQLSLSVPGYGSVSQKIEVRKVKSICRGDSCNMFWVGMENHCGTHVDCPAHFFSEGKKVIDYPCSFWHFTKPQVMKIKVTEDQVITQKNLTDDIRSGTDLLLFQSGWGAFRGKENYSFHNPGLSPELGLWLRQKHISVRAVGIDWISVSPFQNRALGRETHKAFLDPSQEKAAPIVLIEDMNLSGDLCSLGEVIVAPLLIETVDSAPCTVVGFFRAKPLCEGGM